MQNSIRITIRITISTRSSTRSGTRGCLTRASLTIKGPAVSVPRMEFRSDMYHVGHFFKAIHFYSRLRGNAILTTCEILCVTNALVDRSHKAMLLSIKSCDFIRFFIKISQLLFIKNFYFFKT
jgi:hypothetical protein